MPKPLTILLLVLLSMFQLCSAQQQKHFANGIYIIDSKVKELVKKKIPSYESTAVGSTFIKMYENDSLVFDNYVTGKSLEELDMSFLWGDTANIFGFSGMTAGFGFNIFLCKDTCMVYHIVKTDAEIYKLHKTDSLEFGLNVPCVSYKLTLAEKPKFKEGEVIEGMIELTSDSYYEDGNDGEKKYRMQLTSYFKAPPLQTIAQKLK